MKLNEYKYLLVSLRPLSTLVENSQSNDTEMTETEFFDIPVTQSTQSRKH